jgi:hypothetical protein
MPFSGSRMTVWVDRTCHLGTTTSIVNLGPKQAIVRLPCSQFALPPGNLQPEWIRKPCPERPR